MFFGYNNCYAVFHQPVLVHKSLNFNYELKNKKFDFILKSMKNIMKYWFMRKKIKRFFLQSVRSTAYRKFYRCLYGICKAVRILIISNDLKEKKKKKGVNPRERCITVASRSLLKYNAIISYFRKTVSLCTLFYRKIWSFWRGNHPFFVLLNFNPTWIFNGERFSLRTPNPLER